MPLVGVVIAVLGVSLSLLTLTRSQSQAVGSLEPTNGYSSLGIYPPKVHYTNGDILVAVRNPGEWHDLRDQPVSQRYLG